MIYWRKLTNRLADGYTYASDNISSRLKDIGVLNLEDICSFDSDVKSVCVDEYSGIGLFQNQRHRVFLLTIVCHVIIVMTVIIL